jgi:hypothetical protein
MTWDHTQAAFEGWGLFDEDGVVALHHLSWACRFTSDQEAVAFVTEKAEAGSAYHQEAIRLNGTTISYSTEEPE